MTLHKDVVRPLLAAFVFVFLAFFVAASAYASPVFDEVQMAPGPARKVYCPHCHAVKLIATIASGNTLGATMWSDMKQDAPMMPQASYVQKCEACGKYFSLAPWADYEVEPEYADDGAAGTWGYLTLAEWKEAVAQLEADNKYTGEDDKASVYINFLQSYNDEFFRSKEPKEPTEADKAFFAEYVKKLAGILPVDKLSADASLMVLEFYREAGMWDEIAELQPKVDKIVSTRNDGYKIVYKQFTDRIKARDTRIFVVKY